MKKFLRAVTFVAMVCLIATGCTNINDPTTLKEEQFVVNKMWLSGFSISGLDKSLDGQTAELVMVTKVETVVDGKVDEGQTENTEETIASAKVGDTDELYISGCTYVKLEEPVLIERDKDKTKVVDEKTTKNTSTSYYVKITTDSGVVVVKALGDGNALENAVLEVVPSPYGTKDDELEARFVTVQASNAKDSAEIIGTFAWGKDVEKPITKFYICGACNFDKSNKFDVMTIKDKDTRTYEFEYKSEMSKNWESPENGVAFKIIPGVDVWDPVYFADAKLEPGKGWVNCGTNSGNNATAESLEDGVTYIISLNIADPSAIKAKIDVKN